MDEILETSRVWAKKRDDDSLDEFSPMGLFATMEILIDTEHKNSLIGEIEEKIEQVYSHINMLKGMIPELTDLENFLEFVKKEEIVVD